MKIIVSGPPLTGKSTLAAYLRGTHPELPVVDHDEEILRRNHDEWPGYGSEIIKRLNEEVITKVLTMPNVVFMTFYISESDLQHARELGFTIFLLITDVDVLSRRNDERLKTQPTNTAFRYVESNIARQRDLQQKGLIDRELDATKPTPQLIEELLRANNA